MTTGTTYIVKRLRNVRRWLPILAYMDRVCFPGDTPHVFEGTTVWLVSDNTTKEVVGYASAKLVAPRTVFWSRVGVLPACRGQKLQKRLLRACIRFYRKPDWRLITYTALYNVASSNGLISAGFKLYRPRAARWSPTDRNWTYFILRW